MRNLSDVIPPPPPPARYADWQSPDLNVVATAIRESANIELDAETTGLRWWAGDRPVGWAVDTDAGAWYLPVGHRGGPNLDRGQTYAMLRDALRGKPVTNLNTRFDLHMAREDGLDLEAVGITPSDVAHHAALLDDHRRTFNLEALSQDMLGEGKLTDIDVTRIAEYHPGEAAPYAIRDVQLVRRLREHMAPKLAAEDLGAVKALEDDVIFVVCEMERHASPIDVGKLDAWRVAVDREFQSLLMGVYKRTGLRLNPDKSSDWAKLFAHLKIENDARTATGKASFTDAVLATVDHPDVKDGRRAGKLADLNSKYLVKYRKTVKDDGLLRYALHQLRYHDDHSGFDDYGGTVSGRFSSAAIKLNDETVGANIQQVLAVEKQRATYGDDYLIRELFIPGAGKYLAADADQMEYRIFAHYANSPRINAAYQKDPRLSFHKLTHEMLKQRRPDLLYKSMKNLNFARIYGAGLMKIAIMMGYITEEEATQIRRESGRTYRHHPKLRPVLAIDQIYNRELPEVRPLLARASHLAKTCCDDDCNRGDRWHRERLPHRGYVKTLMGRRGRFPNGQRLHKSLNVIVQGGSADINKKKLVELHRERKYTGLVMRLTNHDEVTGDALLSETAARVAEILDAQSFELRVPITWTVKTGTNWAECD